jgi:hypothetical protein
MTELIDVQSLKTFSMCPDVDKLVEFIKENAVYGQFYKPVIIWKIANGVWTPEHQMFKFLFKMDVIVSLNDQTHSRFTVEHCYISPYSKIKTNEEYIVRYIDGGIMRKLGEVLLTLGSIKQMIFISNSDPIQVGTEMY